MNALLQGSEIETLPKTFRDAIVVSRGLGVRFLWIDGLCIIQDSREDWESESATMGSVYANALCNIAASASDGPEGGLFRTRNAENIRLGRVRTSPLPDTRTETFNIIDQLYTHRQLYYTPFFKRGWIFQERILAARVIYFAEEQVFWECREDLKCEAFQEGIPFNGTLKNLLPEPLDSSSSGIQHECASCAIFRKWNKLVQKYSECQFTHASDKIPAFEGIASYFKPLISNEYAFGMWNSRLDSQLGFSVEVPVMKRTMEYRAPSWSWASLDGSIQFNYLLGPEWQKPFTHIQLQGDGFSQGRLHVRGILTRASYSRSTSKRYSDVVLEGGATLNLVLLKDYQSVSFNKGTKLTLLVFQSHFDELPSLDCFVLEPVLCALPAATYRRIGFAHVFPHEELSPDDVDPMKFQPLGIMFEDGQVNVDKPRLSDLVLI